MSPTARRLVPAAVTLLLGTSAALHAGGEIFSDGFESGDTSAWSAAVGVVVDCTAGLAPGTPLAGDLGPAPGGAFTEIACVEITNDLAVARREIAYSGVPLPEALGLTTTDTLALVGPGDRRLAAQFDVLSRWAGRLDDAALPIRWLQVAVPAPVAAGSTSIYSLRSYDVLPAVVDPFAASVAEQGGGVLAVDTGLATFTVDPANPALLAEIAIDTDDDGIGRTTVYTHAAGAGPRLVFDDAGTPTTLSTAVGGQVAVDPGGFDVVESGPVKVVVALRGHFTGGGESVCTTAGVTAYDRFGFSAVMTFFRGRRDVVLQYHLRNECSTAFGEPWTDEAVGVVSASWELPFTLTTPARYYAGSDAVTPTAAALVEVEQRRGADPGGGWMRRAEVRLDGVAQGGETAETYTAPQVAVADATVVVSAHMPWMRYREPQSLAIDGDTVSLRVVSPDPGGEPLVLGEGKGIWSFAKVAIDPVDLVQGDVASALESERAAAVAELERGLLVRMPLEPFNSSQVLPSLGTGASSVMKDTYLSWMEQLHAETVDPGGQWDRNKTYGSQFWPETGSNDPFSIDADIPNEGRAGMNYWDPAGAELTEFLRSGDPKWVWDFALPGSWTQLFLAYLNIGDHAHGNFNGAAVQSGGPGCDFDPASKQGDCVEVLACTPDGTGGGQWHRSDCGSSDYTYDMGQDLAYVIRPNPLVRRRFAQAGRMAYDRYSTPRSQQDTRELFVDQVDITRGVIQHFEQLANCAEFVPDMGAAGDGDGGEDCHERLVGFTDLGDLGVVNELVLDNGFAGVMCQGDAVDLAAQGSCFTPQQFMKNALMYLFFHRVYRNYGELPGPPPGSFLRLLVEDPVDYYEYGVARNGAAIELFDEWAEGMECTFTAGGDDVASCADWDPTPGVALLDHNRPHTLALLLMAHELDPSIGLCQIVKDAYDADGEPDGDADLAFGWGDQHFNAAGWWKGTAQQMQAMAFGIGVYDTCSDP